MSEMSKVLGFSLQTGIIRYSQQDVGRSGAWDGFNLPFDGDGVRPHLHSANEHVLRGLLATEPRMSENAEKEPLNWIGKPCWYCHHGAPTDNKTTPGPPRFSHTNSLFPYLCKIFNPKFDMAINELFDQAVICIL